MKNNFTKIISLLLIIGMNWSAISLIAGTDAYFNDTEISENNALTAGVLDFSLYSAADFTPEITLAQNSVREIIVNDNSTMDYNYKVKVESSPGGLCDELLLDDGNGPQALNTFSAEVLYPDKFVWTFIASLVSGSSGWEGESCYFDLVFEGWQDNMIYGAGGFSDVERISNVISNGDQPPVLSSCMKINEVYYDPDNSHGNANDEWIELYNSCDYEVNIKNWYLEDNQGQSYREIIHSNYDVKPGQFVVIADNASTWAYWPNIPTNAFKIALGGTELFNGLANTSDRVVLYNDNNNEVDCVDWGGDNYCGFSDGSVGDVSKGHSISRKTAGVDNNLASDWFDTHSASLPSPGPNPGTNPHSEDGTLLFFPPQVADYTLEPPVIDDGDGDADTGDTGDGDTTDTDDTGDGNTTDTSDTTDDADDTDDGDDTDDDDDTTTDDAETTDDGDGATDDDTTDTDDGDDTTDGADDTTDDDVDDGDTDTDDDGDNNGDDTGDGADTDGGDTTDDTTDADDTTDDADDDTQDTGDGDADAEDGDTGDGDTGEEAKSETGGDDTTGSTPEDGTDGDGADGDLGDK